MLDADPVNLLAIMLMALATYATRAAGLLLAALLPHEGRLLAALQALPPAVLTAVIAPALAQGPAEMLAGLLTALAAWRLPLIAAVALGVAALALLRLAL